MSRHIDYQRRIDTVRGRIVSAFMVSYVVSRFAEACQGARSKLRQPFRGKRAHLIPHDGVSVTKHWSRWPYCDDLCLAPRRASLARYRRTCQ